MDSRRAGVKAAETCLAVFDPPDRYSSVARGMPREKELVAELKRSARSTQRRPITDARQVMLGSGGRTLSGFAYSVNALRQLCRLLGRGFSQTIFDLGAVVKSSEDDGPFEPSLAIGWLNDLIRLRFDRRLKDYELIVDVERKRIDGLVGTRYAYLSNLAFYERVRRALTGAPVAFHEAVLGGRRLVLRFRSKATVFTLPGEPPEPFYGGFHFGNSEVGDCSVRTAVLLIRQRADTKAVSEFSDRGRLLHIRGPQFEEKLGQQLSLIRERADEPAGLRSRMEDLRQRSLGLVGGEDAARRRVASLTRRLQQWGLHRALAQRVLSRTRLLGASLTDDETGRARMGMTERTEWDLFNAMTYVAKRQPPESQERLEQLAYQLLSGRKTLT